MRCDHLSVGGMCQRPCRHTTMADLVLTKQGIEGDAVEGSSRDPLLSRGPDLADDNTTRCYRYTASFNVRAKITRPGGPPPVFFPAASTSSLDQLICDRALIQSFDRKPSKKVEPGSGRHQTNGWTFKKRTGVLIEQMHKELKDAIEKREREKTALRAGEDLIKLLRDREPIQE